MEYIMSTIISWVVGILILVLFIAIFGGIISVGMYFGSGHNRIEAVILVISESSLRKYMPAAITHTVGGRSNTNILPAVMKFFGHATDILNEAQVKRWLIDRKLVASYDYPNAPASSDKVTQVALKRLLQGDFPRERLKRIKNLSAYSINCKGAEEADKPYLIVVGNIPSLGGVLNFADRLLVMLGAALVGASILPGLYMVYVGISSPSHVSIESLKVVLASDFQIMAVLASVGAFIGLIVGLVQAIRGKAF